MSSKTSTIIPAELGDDAFRVLRRLSGGRHEIPQRDTHVASRLTELGLIAPPSDNYRGRALTAEGIRLLEEHDGPLTEQERRCWLSWSKTRFGKDGRPQKLLQTTYGPRWRSFDLPRARALMERWGKYGVRSESW
jgi:hypothetical protein